MPIWKFTLVRNASVRDLEASSKGDFLPRGEELIAVLETAWTSWMSEGPSRIRIE